MKISTEFEHLIQTRKNIIKLLDKHSDQVHVVPANFNNSLLWNAAHCLVTMQLLVYKLSKQTPTISDAYIDLYKKGTKAEVNDGQIKLEELKTALLSTADELKRDHEQGKFKTYNTYPTSYGIALNNVEEAISFNNVHEGLHLGYMMALSKKL